MVFVPTVPPRRETSARAQDLGRRLKAEVEKFEAQYPGTSQADLRDAILIAIGKAPVAEPTRRRIAAMTGAGVAVLGVLAALFVGRGTGGGDSAGWPEWPIGLAVGIVVVLAIRWLKRR
ncbi:MAG TPA: hypothetical protein PKA66_08580 [Gemmatimonadales bacterium]|nr:hypothetical protein [Gemmatimonadales bacterium]